MYFVKAEIAEGATLEIEIKDGENTYARCPVCGKEVKIDLADIFEDGDGLHGALYCPECWETVKAQPLEDEPEKQGGNRCLHQGRKG